MDRYEKWCTAVAAACVVALGVTSPSALPAQEEPQRESTKVEVSVFQVPGYEKPAFESAVTGFVEAAKNADMGPDFTWWTSEGDGGTYTVVSPVKTMARFDDPEAFMKKIVGTRGESAFRRAVTQVEKLHYRVNTFVAMSVPEWGYQPAKALASAPMTRVLTVKLRPGMDEALGENVAAWKRAWKEVGAPYPMTAYRNLIGEGGKVHFVFSVDNLENAFGKNSTARLFGAAGMQEDYERLLSDFMECVEEYEWSTDTYRGDLSYAPEGA